MQALLGLPRVNAVHPGGERLGVRACLRGFKLREKLCENLAHVAHDRNVGSDVFGNRTRINVNLNDGALIFLPVGGISDHTVIKARPHGKDNVTALHRHVGFVGTVHADHAETLAVFGVKPADAHQGCHNGVAQKRGDAV